MILKSECKIKLWARNHVARDGSHVMLPSMELIQQSEDVQKIRSVRNLARDRRHMMLPFKKVF